MVSVIDQIALSVVVALSAWMIQSWYYSRIWGRRLKWRYFPLAGAALMCKRRCPEWEIKDLDSYKPAIVDVRAEVVLSNTQDGQWCDRCLTSAQWSAEALVLVNFNGSPIGTTWETLTRCSRCDPDS